MIREESHRYFIGFWQRAVFTYELGERRVSVLLLTKIARVFSISIAESVGMARPVRVANDKVSPRALSPPSDCRRCARLTSASSSDLLIRSQRRHDDVSAR